MTEEEADREVERRNTSGGETQTEWYEGDLFYVAVETSPGEWGVELRQGKPPARIWQIIGHIFS